MIVRMKRDKNTRIFLIFLLVFDQHLFLVRGTEIFIMFETSYV